MKVAEAGSWVSPSVVSRREQSRKSGENWARRAAEGDPSAQESEASLPPTSLPFIRSGSAHRAAAGRFSRHAQWRHRPTGQSLPATAPRSWRAPKRHHKPTNPASPGPRGPPTLPLSLLPSPTIQQILGAASHGEAALRRRARSRARRGKAESSRERPCGGPPLGGSAAQPQVAARCLRPSGCRGGSLERPQRRSELSGPGPRPAFIYRSAWEGQRGPSWGSLDCEQRLTELASPEADGNCAGPPPTHLRGVWAPPV